MGSNKFLNWIKGAVGFLANLLTTNKITSAIALVTLIVDIIRQVEKIGGSSSEKRAQAFMLIVDVVPEMVEHGVKIMKEEDATGKPCFVNGQLDSDCDGVADADDKCPTEGDQGCGVDKDGCPIPCAE